MSIRDNVLLTNSLTEGDIIEFNYDGGSNPGSKRLVYVLDDGTNKNIMTWDFNKETLRTFTRSKIRNIRFLEDNEYKIVNINNLPKSYDISDIITTFEDEGYKVYTSDDTIVAVNLTNKNLLRGYSNGKIFFDVNGHNVGLEIIGHDVKMLVDNDVYNPVTIEDLARVFNS